MAKSSAFSTSNQYVKYGIEVIENSVNVANNSSNVTVKVMVWRTNQGYETYGNGTVTVVINGTTYTKSIGRDKVFTYNSYTVVFNGTNNVTHNSSGAKNLTVSAKIEHSQFTTGTNSFTTPLTTIARYAAITQTLANKTETTLTVQWVTDATVDQLSYSIDNGSTWESVAIADSTGGTFTIEGLDAGTEYTVKTKVRRKDSQLSSTSADLTVSTYDYPFANSMPDFVIGESVAIGLYNPLNRSVTVSMVGEDNTEYGSITTTGTQITGFNDVSWQAWLYSTIPDSQSGDYSIKVVYGEIERTETGGTYTAQPSDILPVIGTASYADTNPFTIEATGDTSKIIRNQSTVQYTVSGLAGAGSATISSVTVTVNGNTYNLGISGSTATGGGAVIDSAYDVQAVFTVVDSRGIVATKTVTVTMLDWTLPTAIITLHRKNNFYSETYITVDADFSYIDGANQGVITYKARKAGTSTYTLSGTLQDNVQATISCDNEYEWEFVITLTDIFNVSVSYNAFLSRGIPIIYFDRLLSSVGVGCFPVNPNTLELNGIDMAKNIMTRTLNAEITNLQTNSYTAIPLNTDLKTGGKLSVTNDGGIEIGDKVSKVLVSGRMAIRCAASAGQRYLRIVKNSYSADNTLGWVDKSLAASAIDSLSITPMLVEVSPHDVIYLMYYTGASGDRIIGNTIGGKTSLTIEIVE